jgi:hypothetical protein
MNTWASYRSMPLEASHTRDIFSGYGHCSRMLIAMRKRDVFFGQLHDNTNNERSISRKHRSVLNETLHPFSLGLESASGGITGNLHNIYLGTCASMRGACNTTPSVFYMHRCRHSLRYAVETGEYKQCVVIVISRLLESQSQNLCATVPVHLISYFGR